MFHRNAIFVYCNVNYISIYPDFQMNIHINLEKKLFPVVLNYKNATYDIYTFKKINSLS